MNSARNSVFSSDYPESFDEREHRFLCDAIIRGDLQLSISLSWATRLVCELPFMLPRSLARSFSDDWRVYTVCLWFGFLLVLVAITSFFFLPWYFAVFTLPVGPMWINGVRTSCAREIRRLILSDPQFYAVLRDAYPGSFSIRAVTSPKEPPLR